MKLFLIVFSLILILQSAAASNRFSVCENRSKRISCPDNTVIQIKSGFYGRKSTKVCPSRNDHNRNCEAKNSLTKIKYKCQDRRSCTITARNSVFGDPCVGTYKYVELNYYCASFTIFARVCEHETLELSCPPYQSIQIESALYGRQDRTTCPHSHIRTTNCKAGSSFTQVSNRCNGRNSCSVRASNGVFGDPCRNTFKYLQATYRCVV